jgi:hypothetical protein
MGSGAARAVVAHSNGVVALVKMIGYPGENAQTYNHPDTHQRKRH